MPDRVVSRERFGKQMRERAKKDRAQAKRDRRESRAQLDEGDPHARLPEADVLTALAALHDEFQSGAVEFDDYERRKQELTTQLDV